MLNKAFETNERCVLIARKRVTALRYFALSSLELSVLGFVANDNRVSISGFVNYCEFLSNNKTSINWKGGKSYPG